MAPPFELKKYCILRVSEVTKELNALWIDRHSAVIQRYIKQEYFNVFIDKKPVTVLYVECSDQYPDKLALIVKNNRHLPKNPTMVCFPNIYIRVKKPQHVSPLYTLGIIDLMTMQDITKVQVQPVQNQSTPTIIKPKPAFEITCGGKGMCNPT